MLKAICHNDAMEELAEVIKRVQLAMEKPVLEIIGNDEGLRETNDEEGMIIDGN
jgi:hypothetical protein